MEVQRVLRDVEELTGKNKLLEAKQLLIRKILEAKKYENWNAELAFLNEQMKLYQELNEQDEGMAVAQEALDLARQHGLKGSLNYARTLLNAALTFRIFGCAGEAMELYMEAYEIYQEKLHPFDYRFAGLYNHMGLACEEIKKYDLAEKYFNQALEIIARLPRGEMELAITHINLACVYYLAKNSNKAEFHIQKSKDYFNSRRVLRDGYYAHVCLDCAASFDKIGKREEAKELRKRARKIYEGA